MEEANSVIPSCYIEFSCLMVFNYLNMGIRGKCILWLGIRCIYAPPLHLPSLGAHAGKCLIHRDLG